VETKIAGGNEQGLMREEGGGPCRAAAQADGLPVPKIPIVPFPTVRRTVTIFLHLDNERCVNRITVLQRLFADNAEQLAGRLVVVTEQAVRSARNP
jgi:hypothetical protein